MDITFNAFDYTKDDTFVTAEYRITGERDKGWSVTRNDHPHLEVGSGYELLKTLSCGICSTDIDRRFLPYELPQVIGHEAICHRPGEQDLFALEISDSPVARGDKTLDRFSAEGLANHQPGRMVLGIDRLPGGFGPYMLSPVNTMIPLEGLDINAAILIEPFAAALQAVTSSPPKAGDTVVVLGPRRLGSLLIAALVAYRASSGIDFQIGAAARHHHILEMCQMLGADFSVDLANSQPDAFSAAFDIVYDTTGTASGFEAALTMANREVHLKSTSGQVMCDFTGLSALVVDELAILPLNDETLTYLWPGEKRVNERVLIAPLNKSVSLDSNRYVTYHSSIENAEQILKGTDFSHRLPRFDTAIAGSVAEIDGLIRPSTEREESLIRPRGAILFKGDAKGNKLLSFLNKGGALRSSRCGDFKLARQILKENPQTAFNLGHYLVSHVFPASELPTAFEYAKRKEAIKVVIKHI